MRARTAYLMTSWWVVGVWIGLSIITGSLSIIAVLQPGWYVRYTLVHVQALKDVNFQVVVSSLGPLGFCRLISVESHRVIDISVVPSISLEGLTTSEDRPKTDSEASGFPQSLKPKDSTTGSFTWIPQLTTSLNAEPEEENVVDEAPLEVYSEEYKPTESMPTTSSMSDTKIISQSSFPFHIKGDTTHIRSSMPPPTLNTQSTGREVKSEVLKEVLFRITESHDDVSLESRLQKPSGDELESPNEEDGDAGDSKIQNSFTENNMISKDDKEDDRDVFPNRQGFTEGKEVTRKDLKSRKHSQHTHISNRKRKKKKKKKKKRKTKRKNKKKRKDGVVKLNHSEFQEVKIGPRSEFTYTDINPEINAVTNVTFPNILKDVMVSGGDITAEFLIQQDRPLAFQRKLLGSSYRPRLPILACSGVSFGTETGSSAVWVLVGMVYGAAGVVQVLSGLASALSHAVGSPAGRYSHAIWLGNLQVAVVMSQGVALVLFPLGLGSPLARVECGGSSTVYWPGDCSFGWAYMLAIVATTLAAYCPFLSRLTVYKKYVIRGWESLNFF